MVWCEVKRLEKSKYNNHSYVVFFEYFGREQHSIITKKVLNYVSTEKLEITKISVGDKIFVTKGFNRADKPVYYIKKCLKKIL